MAGLDVTLKVEMAFGDNWQTAEASRTYTDVSAYVRSGSTSLGRRHELDRFETGSAILILDNRSDRRFEPEYASGAYYPDIVPGVPVKITATYLTSYPVWYGYVESWAPAYRWTDAVTQVTCVGAFAMLQDTAEDANAEGYTDMVIGGSLGRALAHYSMNDSASPLDNATGTAAYDLTVTGSPTYSVAGPITLAKAITFNGTTQWATVTGLSTAGSYLAYSAWIKMPTLPSSGELYVISSLLSVDAVANDFVVGRSSVDSLYYLGYVDASTGAIAKLAWTTPAINTWYHVAVRFTSGTSWAFYVDGVSLGTSVLTHDKRPITAIAIAKSTDATPTSPTGFATYSLFDGSISEVSFFDSLTEASVVALASSTGESFAAQTADARIGDLLDTAGWPSDRRDLATGTYTLPAGIHSYRIMEEAHRAAYSDGGYLWEDPTGDINFHDGTWRATNSPTSDFTFTDSHYQELVLAYDTQHIRNVVAYTDATGTVYTTSDATSVAAYGYHPLVRQLHTNAANTATLAAAALADFKDPQLRIESLTFRAQKTPATLWKQALERGIGDRITIQRSPPGGGADISKAVYIEGIEHSFVPGDWVTTFHTSVVV